MVFFQFCNNLLVHKLSLYSRQGRYYFAFRCVGYLKKKVVVNIQMLFSQIK